MFHTIYVLYFVHTAQHICIGHTHSSSLHPGVLKSTPIHTKLNAITHIHPRTTAPGGKHLGQTISENYVGYKHSKHTCHLRKVSLKYTKCLILLISSKSNVSL